MPYYEYQCPRCARRTEVFHSIKEDPVQTCVVCNRPMERTISLSTFVLKGDGWAVDGYSKSQKN